MIALHLACLHSIAYHLEQNWSPNEKNPTLALVAMMVFNGALEAASPTARFIEQAQNFGVPVSSMLDSVGAQTIMPGVEGSLFVPLSDRYGRKPTYIVTSVIATLGSLDCSLATSLGGFLLPEEYKSPYHSILHNFED